MFYHSESYLKFFITLAGTPATRVYGGTSWVTTLPEATCDISPIVFPGSIIALVSIEAPLQTLTLANMPLPAMLGVSKVYSWLPVTIDARVPTLA
ncbi:hypothetical protein ED352_08390 [Muribaculaceae bacterium Isolate-002 (NCI)]|nr:hypothetical protein ED352_08390 [Muribaculaceae bacterium Isolate-002 (NCI)]